jgi:predicted phage terminase large subunit-like protein
MDLPLSTEAYRKEKARRALERAEEDAAKIRGECQSLHEFVRQAWHILEPTKKFLTGWALRAMCDLLERVTAGQIQYLLMNVPPGMMKSLLLVFWTAWEWGPKGRPDLSYLATSYSEDNLDRDADKVRKLIQSDWYRMLWPEVEIRKTRNAIDMFELTAGGWMDSRAFRSMTGGRADRTKIDDPHSVDGGESEVQRSGTIRTFREGISDRLNDLTTSVMVVIMQRIHEEDVSGVLLELDIGFVHLCLPMEYDSSRHCEIVIDGEVIFSDPRRNDGELLFPERFPRAELDRLRKIKGEYAWAAQYDQRPTPREGGMFKVGMIQVVPNVPGIPRQRVRGWDIAGSTRKTSPYTAVARLCECDGIVYIEDMKRARAEIDAAEKLIVDTAADDGMTVLQSLPQDPGQSGKSQRNQLAMRLTPGNFKFSPESGSKEDRAIPFASMVNAGVVRIVRGPWNSALIDEMQNFPMSRFKDQIDALSRAYAELVMPHTTDPGIAGPMVFTYEDR